ncbi:hut operon transcriptional regulator HutP [Peribacillus psychrosaccharolyticus]|uniref:Hut operon positive regulatory protein n=1 Tax=Peribacillus psychrosaccharolyticus TaxID=1407 RepID=A0A974S122_PERPY|nr:hut operon transcriptional regulator HutP [Peribacillus psychrosaccharolyticus]MEC2057240.1 hut operon transcriptional regulator HutP [Peribacillus psychrosaccharolyticus]MED3742931.1 hut operon transcriptional regulator HutP [Peribacillus psychrosaccharolyticus]QQT01003.1 hut operon transcriptional regulator HutP [Peribacillus psychrosaccharolyticus]
MTQRILIGKLAVLLASLNEEELGFLHPNLTEIRFCKGRVGSMNLQKVIAAVETAAKRERLIEDQHYRETHALYHAILEAIEGVTRGQSGIGEMKRTVGLSFAVVRGKPYLEEAEGEWLAVAFYGTIGAPVKGLEHEAVGLGINHI